jgi:hypothetical protein
MKKIIYTDSDGGVSVCTPAEGARLAISVAINGEEIKSDAPMPVDRFLRRWPVDGAVAEWAETEDEWIARIAAKDVPAGVPFEIVDTSEIPADRTFRNAWKCGNGRVEHDIDKCKSMAHEIRRQKREEEFKPHDDVIAKQIPGKSATEAEAARQVIRAKYDAIQAAIDAAATVDQIKAALL